MTEVNENIEKIKHEKVYSLSTAGKAIILLFILFMNMSCYHLMFNIILPRISYYQQRTNMENVLQKKSVDLHKILVSSANTGLIRGLGSINQELKAAINGDKARADKLEKNLKKVIDKDDSTTIIYAMNKFGDVILSTNSDKATSFKGNNYAFRPYFQNAVNGREDIMLALGITSKARGIYYSAPIYADDLEAVIGVIVLKTNVEWLDNNLSIMPYESLLLNEKGTIFSSSNPENLYMDIPKKLLNDEFNTINSNLQKKLFSKIKNKLIPFSYRFDIDEDTRNWHFIMLVPDDVFTHNDIRIFGTTGAIILLNLIFLSIFMVVRHNQTEKKSRQRIRKSAVTYMEIFNLNSSFIILTSIDLDEVYSFNHRTKEIFLLDNDDKVRNISNIFNSSTVQVIKSKLTQISEGRTSNFDCECVLKNKAKIYVNLSMRYAVIDGVRQILITGTDITRRKLLENELLEVNDKLQESQGSLAQAEKMAGIEDLVFGIVHKTQKPLDTVSNNFSQINKKIRLLNSYYEKSQDLLKRVNDTSLEKKIFELTNVKNQEELSNTFVILDNAVVDSINEIFKIKDTVKKLRVFSKIDATKDDFVDINKAIKETKNILPANLLIGVEFVSVENDIPKIKADAKSINSMLYELFKNGCQAMPEGGTLSVEVKQIENYIQILISDTGCGIDPENKAKIFNPFFSTRPTGQGTGMGLAICHGIIDKLSGHIAIKKSSDKGTTIEILIPVTK